MTDVPYWPVELKYSKSGGVFAEHPATELPGLSQQARAIPDVPAGFVPDPVLPWQ